MIKIRVSYETAAERAAVLKQLAPIIDDAKIKESNNKERYNKLYIEFHPNGIAKLMKTTDCEVKET